MHSQQTEVVGLHHNPGQAHTEINLACMMIVKGTWGYQTYRNYISDGIRNKYKCWQGMGLEHSAAPQHHANTALAAGCTSQFYTKSSTKRNLTALLCLSDQLSSLT